MFCARAPLFAQTRYLQRMTRQNSHIRNVYESLAHLTLRGEGGGKSSQPQSRYFPLEVSDQQLHDEFSHFASVESVYLVTKGGESKSRRAGERSHLRFRKKRQINSFSILAVQFLVVAFLWI